MSWNPTASRLVLLSQLWRLSIDQKVRFLACVDSYDDQTARLKVFDTYQTDKQGDVTYIVDVQNVLEGLNHELLTSGAWLNIVGYVAQQSETKDTTVSSRTIEINAALVWNAGPIKLDEYYAAVKDLQKSAKT